MGLTVADDVKEKKTRKRIPEWREFGDPRNIKGHFRPKKNLKTLIGKGKKWTRASLAEAMGLKDPSVISKWISGKRYMSDEDIVRCSMAAGVSVTWLLDLAKNPNSQGWPPEIMVERWRIHDKIREFSEGKTWEELAQDYHLAIKEVARHERLVDEYCLQKSGCKTMEEFVAMRDDEVEYQLYDHILEEAYYVVSPIPWGEREVFDGYQYEIERIDTDDLNRTITETEEAYPGDYRNLYHLARVMLDEVMKYYPSKALEELTILLNQAHRMTRQS